MILSMRLFGDGVNTSLIDDINQSIFTIIFTNKGEKIYDPDYGASALDYIDKPHYLAQSLIVNIGEAVAKYEPRVKMTSINIITGDSLVRGSIAIQARFKLLSTGIYYTYFYNDTGDVTAS